MGKPEAGKMSQRAVRIGEKMADKYLAFDIETVKLIPAMEDWREHRPLGLACAAGWATGGKKPVIWRGNPGGDRIPERMTPAEAAGMLRELQEYADEGLCTNSPT